MAQYHFGAGVLIANRTDIAAPTPVKFGALQDVSVDFTSTIKELHGQYQFPLDVGRGAAKVSGKAKAAAFSAAAFNAVYFADQLATGQILLANDEAGAIPATTTYTVTVTNSAHFLADMGVTYADTGEPFMNVGSAGTLAAAGQYKEAAGVYTFDVADASANVKITYTYTDATSGSTISIGNPLMGTAPTFSMMLYQVRHNKVTTIILNQAVATKLSIATKLEDFVIPEFDFSAFVDDGNNLGKFSTTDI